MRGADRDRIKAGVRELVCKLPPVFSNLREELAEHLCTGLEPLLQDMNLVTREEYDIQVALLERLRKRVEQLEQRLADEQSNS